MNTQRPEQNYSYLVPVRTTGTIANRRCGLRTDWPWASNWPTPEPLRSPDFGKRDPLLAAFVCESLRRTMPTTEWTWRKPRRHIPAFVGWIVVALIAWALLAGGR